MFQFEEQKIFNLDAALIVAQKNAARFGFNDVVTPM
jgi:hypothetical protein